MTDFKVRQMYHNAGTVTMAPFNCLYQLFDAITVVYCNEQRHKISIDFYRENCINAMAYVNIKVYTFFITLKKYNFKVNKIKI